MMIGITSCSDEQTKTKGNAVSRQSTPTIDKTINDIDGNVYRIARIGSQTWLKSNLNVTRYRNGDAIPQVSDPSQWEYLTTGAWCYNNNDPANGAVYGKLYNWYAVNDPRGLAPMGWHIPNETEWQTLNTFLGNMQGFSGGKMKSVVLWQAPNTDATNSSGFTALPAGMRSYNGFYYETGYNTAFWTSTEYSTQFESAIFHDLTYVNGFLLYSTTFKRAGFSIRCMKD